MKRDLISFSAWSSGQISDLFALTERLKAAEPAGYAPLAHMGAALIFERESLRTRVSFEVGIAQLGGHPIFLPEQTIGLATRESVHDIGQVLSQYCCLIIARTTRHQTCVQLSESASVPVINAMTDLLHPCQILADAFTLRELHLLSPSTRIVFLGDGNNIANSWLELAEKIPLHIVFSCPPGYEPHPQILEQTQSAKTSRVEFIPHPVEAVREADVVYTDVWPTTRGGVDEGRRLQTFKPYQVNKTLLRNAKPGCVVMHRLPANRGEEVTSEVLDGKSSIVLREAENRLHIQKGIMGYLLSAALS
jgi:ornithine carbamoyltransferase